MIEKQPVFAVVLMTAITAVIASLVFLLVSEMSEERNLESMPKVSEDGTSATNETSEDQSERDNDTVSNGGSRDIDSVPIGQIRVWGRRLPSNGSGPDGSIWIASCDDSVPFVGEKACPLEEFTPAPEAGVACMFGDNGSDGTKLFPVIP